MKWHSSYEKPYRLVLFHISHSSVLLTMVGGRVLLLPSVFPIIRIFSNESALHIRWPKYWSFNFISLSNEYSGLISFMTDWFDLLAIQGTLKSLLQHHSSKALILRCSAFFMVQLSHPYMTTGKTIALTIQTFVGKVKLNIQKTKIMASGPIQFSSVDKSCLTLCIP